MESIGSTPNLGLDADYETRIQRGGLLVGRPRGLTNNFSCSPKLHTPYGLIIQARVADRNCSAARSLE